MSMHRRLPRVGATALLVIVLAAPLRADEIPAFARKYGVSCSLCHDPFPRLNAFGETFAGNGFRMAADEVRDTVPTGDPLLTLQKDLPLAVRFDAYVRSISDAEGGQVVTDLQTPWNIKLLSGGMITEKISYYMYFFLSEHGEVAGLEDAYVQFSDALGTGVDVLIGQFQVSDPLFKRELRLEYEDYALYRTRVGDARADLTYDRGIFLGYSPWEGGDVSFQVVNGQGLDEASDLRHFDRDDNKNVIGRFSQQVGPLRLGAFGYLGKEGPGGAEDEITVWGPDATLSLGRHGELNAQWLRREDDNPFLRECSEANPCAPEEEPRTTRVDGALVELLWWPGGANSRLHLYGLYNLVESDDPVFSVRLGQPADLARYETGTLGASYLVGRNARVLGEILWDLELEQARFTVGLVSAF